MTRDVVVFGVSNLGDGVDSTGLFWESLVHGAPLGLCGTLSWTGSGVAEKTPMQNDVKSLILDGCYKPPMTSIVARLHFQSKDCPPSYPEDPQSVQVTDCAGQNHVL